MRIKFLSVIVSFLIVSFALSSCLDSDDNYEFSSDATIHAFGIDTIHGKHYKFTIDQLNRLIYNRDSLPVGSDTIIDRILIDTMTVTGWITSGSPTDTVFVISDSVDLRPAMNNDAGMLFKAHAADGVTVREYKLKVNVHLQDPDSLVWTDMQKRGNVFSNTINSGQQKAVVLGDELFVYTSNTTAYKTSTAPDKYNWSKVNVSNLPSDVKLTSAVEYNSALYMVTESKRVFSSTNGAAWTEVTTLGDNVVTSVRTSTGNGVEKVVLAGMPLANEKETTPWFSLDGKGWASLANTMYDTYCPGMDNPAIMYYGGMFYCFGGELDAIYSSITGIAWSKTETKFLLPQEFKGKGAYSIIVEPTKDKTVAPADKRDFIWVIFGGNGTKNEVWRGRLNRLGFEIQ